MKNPTDKMRASEVYREEYLFLEDARQTLDHPDMSQETLLSSYRSLLSEHETLLRKIVKMTGISDRMQRKLRDANARIEAQQRDLTDSIRCAKRIQRALLPDPGEVRAWLPDSFFLWMPRDIVGGDIYFAARFDDGIVVAVMDCTGHGVPGAFMSMIASSSLRRITTTLNCHDPARILRTLGRMVRTSLQQDRPDTASDDGLDAAVCFIETGSGPLPSRVVFAGARLPLFHVRNGEVGIIKGDKQSLGYKRSDPEFEFTNHTVPVEDGISFYMSSDGFWDQMERDGSGRFGTRAFGIRRFADLLAETSGLPFDVRKKRLFEAFHAHRGEMRIQDDVTVAGFGF